MPLAARAITVFLNLGNLEFKRFNKRLGGPGLRRTDRRQDRRGGGAQRKGGAPMGARAERDGVVFA